MGYTKAAIKGFSWLGALRLSTRGVGYIRIAIIARILSPEQFGFFGIASFSLVFVELLTETGINVVLIQEKQRVDKYIDTAWVISVTRGVVISAILFLLSPFISSFFNAPSTLPLLRMISLVPLLRGLINPAIISFRKDLQYGKFFSYRLAVYLTESIVIVYFALKTGSEISFIYGIAAGVILEILVSFTLVSPRPRFRLKIKQAKKIIKKGYWVTLAVLLNFGNQQGDDAIIAKMLDSSALGIYQNSYKISTLPLTEIASSVSNVSFSVYSKFADDNSRLRRAFRKVWITQTVVIIPFGALLYFFPKEVIQIILGPSWTVAIPILKTLSIFGVLTAINNAPNPVFLAKKRQDIVAKLKSAQLLIMLITIVPLVAEHQTLGAVYAITLSVILVIPATYYSLNKLLK